MSPAEVLAGNPAEQFPVDARKLHAWLGVGRDFSSWIKGRIEEFGFISGSDFSTLGSPKRGISKSLSNPDSRIKGPIEYMMTFDMAKHLAMVERSEKGREVRNYFIACEKQLKESLGKAKQWALSREEGKLARRCETDVIKAFIAYARGQGSENAEMYYTAFSKMVNAALLDLDGKAPEGLRDSLNMIQLHSISVAETVIAKTLVECMNAKRPYKSVYPIAKARIEAFAQVIGKTRPGISARDFVGLVA